MGGGGGGAGMWEMGSNFKRIDMRNRLNLSVTWEDFPGNKVRFRGILAKIGEFTKTKRVKRFCFCPVLVQG